LPQLTSPQSIGKSLARGEIVLNRKGAAAAQALRRAEMIAHPLDGQVGRLGATGKNDADL
jgi:hypothetical protein